MEHTAREVAWLLMDILPRMMRLVQLRLRQSPTWRPAHYGLLYMLSRRPLNLSKLAEQHAASLPTVSASVSRLEEHGWVERRPNPEDRRQVIIHITEAGRQELARMQTEMLDFLEQPLQTLSVEELALVQQAIRVLHRAFMEEPT